MSSPAGENDSRAGLVWTKSSLSYANSNCVEVSRLGNGYIAVRDSKNPDAEMLRFTPAEWRAFLGGVRNGEFDAFADQDG